MSLIRAGLEGAKIGDFVSVIDERGHVATGYLEKYNSDLDVFVVHFAEAEAEVTETTDVSASAREGDFGGNKVNVSPWLRKNAVYLHDPRAGVERFILASEDPQPLIDHTNAANAAGQPLPEGPAAPADSSQGTNAGGTPAPEPQGKTTAPEHPDIAPGIVEEPEPPSVIAPTKQKGPLPDGFPGRAALEAAGVTRFKDLFKQLTNLTAIPGIDAATSAQIKAVLGL